MEHLKRENSLPMEILRRKWTDSAKAPLCNTWMLCRRTQWPDSQSSSLLKHLLHFLWNSPWVFQGQELSCVQATSWSCTTAVNRGKRQQKLWPPWSGPFNSTPQSWWRGGTETGAGNLLPCPEGSCGFRQRVVLQLSGRKQSLKFLCWIHIGSSVTHSS